MQTLLARLSYFVTEWVLSTNHRRIAVLYFFFVLLSGFTGLILATIIRLELAYPGQFFLTNNAERYLTTISLHGVVMVFFMIIPVIFGAFGNFLLPTQLGIRDVAFPRLNSFMFWVTPSGFVLLLHIILFDRSYNLTYWLNYGEVKAALRRRYSSPSTPEASLFPLVSSELDWRLAFSPNKGSSIYQTKKSANPTSGELYLNPLSNHTFFLEGGLPTRMQGASPLSESFTQSFKEQAASPLSPESGSLVTSALKAPQARKGEALKEVLSGYA